MRRFSRGRTFTLRLLFALAAAAALLYTFSYPDSLLPPNPAAGDIDGISLYTFKPVLWLLPLALLELICLAGPRRNRVWFTATLSILIGGLLAWPVLQAWRPELVHPMLEFEDGKLAAGLGSMAILIFISVLLRLVVLAHLFQHAEGWQSSGSDIEATVLDPRNARTVRQIAADSPRVQPRFLFGQADQSIIDHFRHLMGSLWKRTLRRRLLLGLALLGGLLWFFLYPQPSQAEALQRDLAAMYETQAPTQRDAFTLATPRAVHAAWRVMKHIHDHESLAGMTTEQAATWLQLSRAPEAYRSQLRADYTQHIASLDYSFEYRVPFITITDGRHFAALYVSMDAEGRHINVAEVVDSGWNAVADNIRRRFGDDWQINY